MAPIGHHVTMSKRGPFRPHCPQRVNSASQHCSWKRAEPPSVGGSTDKIGQLEVPVDDDVPLERWAQMREHRKRPVGARRALLLVPGESGGSHVNPSAPRLLMEWDGYQWVTVGVGDDHAA